ncbi:MAG: hypothetical protein AAGE52_22625 [Myxococcota bacterium]
MRFIALLLLISCSEGSAPSAPVPGDPGPRPRPVRDSAVPDTSTPSVDASSQAVACESFPVELSLDPISRARQVSVGTNETGFVFAWSDARSVTEDVRIADLPSDAVAVMETRLTEDGASVRSVEVTDGLAVWLDDAGRGAPYGVRGAEVGRPADEVWVFSDAEGDHASPQVVAVEDGWIVAWLRRPPGSDRWQVEMRPVDNAGETGDVVQLPYEATTPSLSFSNASNLLYLAWVDGDDVFVGRTSLTGESAIDASQVSTESNAAGDLSIAFGPDGGIATFGVRVAGIRPEIRSRLLDVNGRPQRPEEVVSQAPLKGSVPSAIAFSGGFAVAYRAAHNDEEDHIRLAFVHGSDGDVVAEYSFGESAMDDGAPGVAVDEEGRIGVGWAHRSGSGTAIRGVRLVCAEAWLRCGVER